MADTHERGEPEPTFAQCADWWLSGQLQADPRELLRGLLSEHTALIEAGGAGAGESRVKEALDRVNWCRAWYGRQHVKHPRITQEWLNALHDVEGLAAELVLLRARLDTATQARELAFSNEGLAHLRKRMVGVVKIAEELDHEDPDQAADAAWLVGTVDDFAGAWEGLMAENRALGARLDTAEELLKNAQAELYAAYFAIGLGIGLVRDLGGTTDDRFSDLLSARDSARDSSNSLRAAAALCVEGTEPA